MFVGVPAFLPPHLTMFAGLHNKEALMRAIRSGDLAAVKRMLFITTPLVVEDALQYAALFGKTDIVQHLCKVPLICPAVALCEAAKGGHLDVVKALVQHTEDVDGFAKTPTLSNVFRSALFYDREEVFRFLCTLPKLRFQLGLERSFGYIIDPGWMLDRFVRLGQWPMLDCLCQVMTPADVRVFALKHAKHDKFIRMIVEDLMQWYDSLQYAWVRGVVCAAK